MNAPLWPDRDDILLFLSSLRLPETAPCIAKAPAFGAPGLGMDRFSHSTGSRSHLLHAFRDTCTSMYIVHVVVREEDVLAPWREIAFMTLHARTKKSRAMPCARPGRRPCAPRPPASTASPASPAGTPSRPGSSRIFCSPRCQIQSIFAPRRRDAETPRNNNRHSDHTTTWKMHMDVQVSQKAWRR